MLFDLDIRGLDFHQSISEGTGILLITKLYSLTFKNIFITLVNLAKIKNTLLSDKMLYDRNEIPSLDTLSKFSVSIVN